MHYHNNVEVFFHLVRRLLNNLLVNEFLAKLEAKLKVLAFLYLIPLFSCYRSDMDSPGLFHFYILCQTPNSSL